MTVYNKMVRCWEGGQKLPLTTIAYRGRLLGECSGCGAWFKLYPNGKVVVHKRKSRVTR